ncbi:hypothetical protein Val02_30160 [Virgisporangium aliadipatigenens]|uniref:Uncharacterized protein n=1 Tax=Virgisporangium aliadipatigenens TaxID=741659 RepID=A0A8J3YLG5_9ACTN|nr:hypothetical protein [Virgisporangium aliadipatigenens]GIJ46130.1 hypothetical protein Val02_30160 [Virgisporangium aliadipatigenens]
MALVAFVDETTSGERSDAWHLEIFEERLTLRELIRRRVFQEVAEHNANSALTFRGLVQPSDTERVRDGFRMSGPRRVDPEAQFERAVEAFTRNGFVVLVNDEQIEDLETTLELRARTEITFLKLVPLVGG